MEINTMLIENGTTQINKSITAMSYQKNESIPQGNQQSKMDSSYQSTLQEKTIIKAIEEANKKLQGSDKEFKFSIHEKTKQIMVKVIDTNTKEIVKEFPPEKILDMIATMCENAGIFVDKKV